LEQAQIPGPAGSPPDPAATAIAHPAPPPWVKAQINTAGHADAGEPPPDARWPPKAPAEARAPVFDSDLLVSKAARVAVARLVAGAVSESDSACTWGPDPRWAREAEVAVEQILSAWHLQGALDAALAARALSESALAERDALVGRLRAELEAERAGRAAAEAALDGHEEAMAALRKEKRAAEAAAAEAEAVIEEQEGEVQGLLEEVAQRAAEAEAAAVSGGGSRSGARSE
jgi:hypothetical protein